MQLTTRYHLILICVLLISLVIIGSTSYYILHKHAQEEVIKQADVLMEAALAMRKYTITEIKPLLALQNKRNFLPQSVPSYAATQNFEALREKHSEYRYKEATLNPTNPRDRAMDWEADIIQEFRNDADRDHITLVRENPLGATLYYARPIRITNEGCLTCHGIIDDAPRTMVELYGPANGFGWKMDEVVGSQIVSVPISLPIQRANETFFVLISVAAAVFLVLYLLLIYFFRKLFIFQSMTPATGVDDITLNSEDFQEHSVIQDRISTQSRISTHDRISTQGTAPTQDRVSTRERISTQENISTQDPEEHISSGRNVSSVISQHPVQQDSIDFNAVVEDRTQHLDRVDSDEINEVQAQHPGQAVAKEVTEQHTQHLDLDEPDEVVEEGDTTQLNLADSEELPEEYTISLEKMYKKVEPKSSLLDEAFDLEDAFTELSSSSMQNRGKT